MVADMKPAILLLMMLSTLFGFSCGGALISKRQSEPLKKQVATDICDRRYHSSKRKPSHRDIPFNVGKQSAY